MLVPADAPSPDRWPRAIAAVGCTRVLLGLVLGPEPVDDAFITFRYAHNLADGLGFVYNRGQDVLGTTTVGWTAILAAADGAGLPIVGTALVIALLADLATALLLRRLLLELGRTPRASGIAAIIFLLLADPLGLARSGMETSLTCTAIVGVLVLAVRGRATASGVALIAACTLRPEAVLLLPIAALLARSNRDVGRVLLPPAVAGLVWGVGASLHFGSPVPQSLQAKSGTGSISTSLENAIRLLLEGQWGEGPLTATLLQANFVLTTLAAVGTVLILRDRGPILRRASLAVLAFPAAYLAAMVGAGALTVFPWYYGPLYPFFAALAGLGIDELATAATAKRERVVVAALGAVVAPQLLALVLVKLPAEGAATWIEHLRATATAVPDGPATVVAAREIGVVGWELPQSQIVDLVGLVSPEVEEPSRFTEAIIEHRAAYVLYRTDEAPAVAAAFESDPRLVAFEVLVEIPDPAHDRSFVLQHRSPPR